MARFLLQPCHLRGTHLAPLKGTEPVALDWKSLRAKLAPTSDSSSLASLRALRIGAFVGLAKDRYNPAVSRNFMVLNNDRSARLDWVLSKDPTFADRLLEVYRVDDVQWDSSVSEPTLKPVGSH